jgi:hypothetical protein
MMIDHNGEVSILPWGATRIATRVASKFVKSDFELEPGGMVVMSTDVNIFKDDGSKYWGKPFVNKAKSFMKTWWNRIQKNKKVENSLLELSQSQRKNMITGWSIGNLFRGYYVSESGDKFSEKSFSIDIRGVPIEFVMVVARKLRRQFEQESVLVIDHGRNKAIIVDS